MILIVRRLITVKRSRLLDMRPSPPAPEPTPDRKATLRVFGDQVRQIRLALGMSQEDLAAACGLDRTYIGGVERGERNLGLLNIVRVARSLSVRPADLLVGLK